jgi:hypothetical protein
MPSFERSTCSISKPSACKVIERLAEQVVGLETDRKRVKQPLPEWRRHERAAHVFE